MKNMKPVTGNLMIILLLTLSSCSNPDKSDQSADDGPEDSPSQKQSRNNYGASSDKNKLIIVAGSNGLMEVQAAKIALEKSRDSAVQDLAKMIMEDHEEINKKLTELVAASEMQAQKKMLESHKEKILKLQSVSSEYFDQRYVEMIIETHNTAIKMLKDAAIGGASSEPADTTTTTAQQESGDQLDREIRSWIQETLPVLQKHLDQAKEIQSQL